MPAPELGVKGRVLEEFLAFANRHGERDRMRFATMGGAGHEARLWQRAGIPAANGWLIERGRTESRALLSSFPYRVTNSLSTLARVFASVYGPDAGLDALHLDFCGTLEAQVNAVRPVLPLLFKGNGARCLAITVADARRNTALEAFRDVWYRSFRLVGARRAQGFLRDLTEQQKTIPGPELSTAVPLTRFNPRKSAQREFALFVQIGELLREFPYVPDEIKRFVYTSRTSGYPFRMRTYLVHFVPSGFEPHERSCLSLERWPASPFHHVTEAGMTPVQVVVRPEGREEEHVAMPTDPYAVLRAAVAHMNPAAQAEFAKLEEAAGKNTELAAELDRVKAEMAELTRTIEGQVDLLKKKLEALIGSKRPAASTDAPLPSKPAPAISGEDATKLLVQKDLLAALATGDAKKLEVAKKKARETLGLKKKDAGRIVGGLLARTQGKFRGNFVRRAMHTLHRVDALLPELADYYSKIEGKPVTPHELELKALPATSTS